MHQLIRIIRNNIQSGFCAIVLILAGGVSSGAGNYSITIGPPEPAQLENFHMGTAIRPDGSLLTLDSDSLLLDGRPWTPVMGEFHYSRYPQMEWRSELLKMKAGGVDIVSTYVFWIHQEEIEGQFDWSGRRDLRQFVQTCGDVGLKVLVRCGPWDHGEVRNGGYPDWLLKKNWHLRSDDSNYLAQVKIFYGQIAKQLDGLLWKEGGPVVGIQLENEYSGPAGHLLTLKRLAREAGLDVPLYTKTGWPMLSTALPFGEIIPLYSTYAEGFWDRELTSMPANYWTAFQFSRVRTDEAIFGDLEGKTDMHEPPDTRKYPYLTCEIGGGMENSYHRRILINPLDVESTTLVRLGDGGVSLGYYMYQGGVNPDGKLTTMEESQASGGWSDLPVRNYDFQAPLGAYGEIRPQYNLLRRLHLFLHEWGAELVNMPATMPVQRPHGANDFTTLRWDVRSNGTNGFVFVNNYQRLQPSPPKTNVQFAIHLVSSSLTFPSQSITIPTNACFFWPFKLDLGQNVQLDWATAQPVTAIDDGKLRTVFFAQTEGVPAEFAFNSNAGVKSFSGKMTQVNNRWIIDHIKPGTDPAVEVSGTNGSVVRIVLLNGADSLALWKGEWQARERVFLTQAGLVLDGNDLRLTSAKATNLTVGIYPAPATVTFQAKALRHEDNGVFEEFIPPAPQLEAYRVKYVEIQPAGPLRKISLGKIAQPVAAAPTDADFKAAAVWKITLPPGLDLNTDPLLQIHYVGDVARVTLNGKLLVDDFFNGDTFEMGLRRYAPEILKGDLRLAVLPLQKNAPILLPKAAEPDFGSARSVVGLKGVELIPRYQVQLSALQTDNSDK